MSEGKFRLHWAKTKDAVPTKVYYDPETAVDVARAVALITGRAVEVRGDASGVVATVGPDEWEEAHADEGVGMMTVSR